MHKSHRFVLARRPRGQVVVDDFAADIVELPALRDGEMLVETLWISIDPAMRGWLDDRPNYLPPVRIGEPVRALGLARVIESRMPEIDTGQVVRGFVGWQEKFISSDLAAWELITESPDVPLPFRLGVLGMTGMTAWVGMKEIAEVGPGDTVVVSAAAGAVGSVAAQIAKAAGGRVVGIAGGPEKCRLLKETLRLDAVVDHQASDWKAQLEQATPSGIDVNFENVGGQIMEAVIDRLNNHARMVLCGLIEGYNLEQRPPGPRNFGKVIAKRVHLQGFIVLDYLDRTAEIERSLTTMISSKAIQPLGTIVHGFESLPEVFVSSFSSQHVGKLLVGLTDE